jgi:hypothetical protein
MNNVSETYESDEKRHVIITKLIISILNIGWQSKSLPSVRFIHTLIHQWLYSPLLDPGLFFSFVIISTDSRIPWMSEQPVTRPLPTHRTTQTQNKSTQTSMPWVGFELTIPALQRTATVIDFRKETYWKYLQTWFRPKPFWYKAPIPFWALPYPHAPCSIYLNKYNNWHSYFYYNLW